MATRSIVTFNDEWDGEEICAVYRQNDGYPEGRGKELEEFLNGYRIGDGICYGIDDAPGVKYANGMRELAVLWIAEEKSRNMSGNVYLERAGFRSYDLEWIYSVNRGKDGKPFVIVHDVYGRKVYKSIEGAIRARRCD